MQSFKWKSKLDRPVLELIKLHDHTTNVILSNFVAEFNEFLDVERNLNVLHLLGCGPELWSGRSRLQKSG
ncbi:hypothetical protein RvY_12671 [Ramazzottius varieornatus]|uniref:Uncharacterized protein n=1 Tax=Ramazzottius varieornatus TaxID=947166 RepID=A0A1D1VQQ5_RAMVA|nr:hypothetical protein RvY_12671 [Ramazzottius varieornatus]